MKNLTVLVGLLLLTINRLEAQDQEKPSYWQVKVDFLEPLVNQGFITRIDYGSGRHLLGLVGGFGGRVSEFDNEQFDIYQDKTNFLLGLEYQ